MVSLIKPTWALPYQGLLAEVAPRAEPVLEQLDPARKAKVLAAIAGLIILGLGMMLLAWLGAKATRRYMNREPLIKEKPPAGTTPIREKDWAEKPLANPLDE